MPERPAPGARRTRLVVLVVGAAVLAGVLLVGFLPTRVDGGVEHQVRGFVDWLRALGATWVDYDLIDFLANVGFFVPVGLIAALLLPWRVWWLAVPIGALLSGMLELGQAMFLPARYASWTDVAANTIGALIGAVVGAAIRSLRKRRRAETPPPAPRSAPR